MLMPRKPGDTHSRRRSVRRYLHRPTIPVFIRNNGGNGPSLRTVSRRERASTVKELTALSPVRRTRALSYLLQGTFNNHTINQRLRTQQTRLSCAVVVLGTTNQIESSRNSSESTNRAGVADNATRFRLTLGFGNFVAGYSICSNQRHKPDA